MLKNEKGSITIYVIITMLFFSVFIMSIYIITREQLLSIGSEDRIYIAQEKKIYKFTKEPDKYILKNNITNLTSQDVSSLSTKLLYVKNNNEYKLKNNYLIKIK